jgi:hypothetical protein
MLTFLLLFVALVFFVLATAGVNLPRVAFGWLGAAVVTVAGLVAYWPGS